MIAPCIIVSLSGLVSTVQNEVIFKDNLTGLYNRYYLDQICKEIARSRKPQRTFIMMELNGLKTINDKYGHMVGDKALKETADILKQVVKSKGELIRYAGDEFIVVLNEPAEPFIEAIHKSFEAFNKGREDYALRVSLGCTEVDLSRITADEVMDRIDKLMYEDKRRFYAAHSGEERR